jgi:hypothetical protein
VNGSPLDTPDGTGGTIPTVNQTIDYAVVGALRNNTDYTAQAYGTVSQVAIGTGVLTDAALQAFMESYWIEAESSSPVEYVEKSAMLIDPDYNREADYAYVPTKFSHFSDGSTKTVDLFPGLIPGRNACIDLWYAENLAEIEGNDARATVTTTADDAFVWPAEYDDIIMNLTASDVATRFGKTDIRLSCLDAANRLTRALAANEGVNLSEFSYETASIARLFALLKSPLVNASPS